MRILDKLEARDTDLRSLSSFDNRVTMKEERREVFVPSPAYYREYELSLKIATRFRVQEGPYHDRCREEAEVVAKRLVVADLFSEIHALIAEAESYVYSGDANGTLQILSEMRKAVSSE